MDDWLTDPAKGTEGSLQPADLGGFGAPPWNYVPGEYAGTQAHWIWPETPTGPGKGWWLLRYQF